MVNDPEIVDLLMAEVRSFMGLDRHDDIDPWFMIVLVCNRV